MDGTQLNRSGRTLPRALALVAAALLAAAALPAGASGKTDLSYRNFKQTKGLKLNGSAKKRLHPAVLRLTPNEPDQAGSVFTRRKLINPKKSFQTSFRTYLRRGSLSPGDGLTFTLLKGPATALGNGGSELGYGGIAGPSIAIEHDIWEDDKSPHPFTHIGLLTNGSTSDHLETRSAPFGLLNQRTRTWVVYSAKKKVLRVYVGKRAKRPGKPLFTRKINLAAHFGSGKVRAGFTAATGGEYVVTDLLTWTLKQR